MKTKIYWAALLASAALIAPAQAGDHHGGGRGGGHSAPSAAAPARSRGGPSFHSGQMRNFGGGRMYSGRRFSPVGMHSSSSPAFRQHYISPDGRGAIGTRRFMPGNINRGDRLARSGNNPRFAQGGNDFRRGNGTIENQRNGGGRIGRGGNLPANWQNHVVARHSGNWQRDWDRGRDHRWHNHHCRFINGSWVIFDLGFYPWGTYSYPYDYYPYDYYSESYAYDPGYYGSSYDDSGAYRGEEYYDQNSYESSDQDSDSTIATAQERLARQGYYRGEIDGILGRETRRAIARYQSNHNLRATGYLTKDTLQALGLPRVANN